MTGNYGQKPVWHNTVRDINIHRILAANAADWNTTKCNHCHCF